jgi:hypothetical protein
MNSCFSGQQWFFLLILIMTIITSCSEKKNKIPSSTSSTAEKMTLEEYNEKYHPVGADQQSQSTASVSNNQPTQTASVVPNSQPTQTATVVSNNQVTESSNQSDDDWISISCYPIKRLGHPWMQYEMKFKSIGDKVLITLRSKSGDKYVASKNPNYDQYSGHNIGASQDANDFNYHFTDKYGELMGFIFNF